MATSIFIKTWVNDIPWLRYALASIKMYASGFEETIVVSDESCAKAVSALLTTETLHVVEEWNNGYMQQQWIKLNAFKYTNADTILYTDSDCIFHTPFTPESFMRDGKPILFTTAYDSPDIESGIIWKPVVSAFMGFDVKLEYMRRLPLPYLRSTLIAFNERFPETEQHLRNIQDTEFSEFNVLGAFIDRYEPYNYYIVDTDVWKPPKVAKQFWSWDYITPAIRSEINSYLKVKEANAVK